MWKLSECDMQCSQSCTDPSFFFSSLSLFMGHFLIASGDDQASILVPPQQEATSPRGTWTDS